MKILIISVSAGAGHVRAANAILETARLKHPDTTVEHIDLIDYVTPALKSVLVDTYEVLATRLPEVWGFLYDKTNQDDSSSIRQITRMMNTMNAKRFFAYIEKSRPDHIICTHFLPAHAIQSYGSDAIRPIPLSIIMTDYDFHEWWLTPKPARYFVATPKLEWILRDRGYESVYVTGIPIMPAFSQPKHAPELRIKYGVPADSRIILLLSGGHGLVQIDRMLPLLESSAGSTAVIAIAGKNAKLQRRLEKVTPPASTSLVVVGWTDSIDEYMRMADVIITKPGGITTSECIALQKPMILIKPIPGQEESNTDYILEHRYGVLARTSADLSYYLTQPPASLAPGYATTQKPIEPAAEKILQHTIA